MQDHVSPERAFAADDCVAGLAVLADGDEAANFDARARAVECHRGSVGEAMERASVRLCADAFGYVRTVDPLDQSLRVN